MTATAQPALEQIWAWLGDIPDPEIPVISILDLGIVRDVQWSSSEPGRCDVTVTPTYSGCPATEVIAQNIRQTLADHGVAHAHVHSRIAPPWTTDWITPDGRERLRSFGIVPPGPAAPATHSPLTQLVQITPQSPPCPRCGSARTETLSHFGSTACKSLHRCLACREPFDYFKPY